MYEYFVTLLSVIIHRQNKYVHCQDLVAPLLFPPYRYSSAVTLHIEWIYDLISARDWKYIKLYTNQRSQTY
jgi:hypothetical protein